MNSHFSLAGCLLAIAAIAAAVACGSQAAKVTPTYSQATGKLVELTGDRNGDGRIDIWAQMDGVHLKSIQIDRHGTGHADRWEYYAEGTPAAGTAPTAGSAFDRKTMITRADEANGPDDKTITRHEFYTDGVITRVEEDTDFDGRVDKWETYDHGTLVRMDLDSRGLGKADRRFVYRADGSFDHLEVDAAGDGHFAPVDGRASAASGSAAKTKGGRP